MQSQFPDKRKAITGEFFLYDSRLKNRSRKAFKRIQSWKASLASNTNEPVFHRQFENLVKHSFFNHVSNRYVLLQERFFERPLDN
jgi:hypothetical protein